MANVTTTTAANFIPEIWANEIQMFSKSKLVIANAVKRLDSQVKSKGDTLHVPKVAEVSASQKSASTDVTPVAATEGVFDLSIDQHYYAAHKIEDIAKVQAAYDLRSVYTEADGYAISKKIDSTLAALATGFSQTVGSAGSDLTDANLLLAIQYLDDADAPEADRSLIIKPAVKADILALDKFVLYANVNRERVNTGQIGEVYGVRVLVTTNITTTSGSPDTLNNMLIHKQALALAVQTGPRVQTQYKLESLANLLVVDAIWGVGEYRDTFGVWVKA